MLRLSVLGVPGLACALGLAQQGLAVALIGPRPKLHTATATEPLDPRIYALAPASVELLGRLGAWTSVDPHRVCPIERMRVFGDAGDELTFDAYGATVERLATIIEEGKNCCGYWMQRAAFSLRSREFSQTFVSITAQPALAEVNLEDGSALSARLVIGADGANSSVRAAAGISASDKSYEQAAVVANFESTQPHLNTACQWFTDEGVVALLPLPGDRVSLVWSAPTELAHELASLDSDRLATRIMQRCPSMVLKTIGRAYTFPLRLVTVQRLIAERVALVGDAAHVVHPLAGQGLNLGLQDVALLLDVIREREPFRDLGDTVLLRRYERGRAEAIGLMRFATDSLAHLFALDDPLARRLRNAGMTAGEPAESTEKRPNSPGARLKIRFHGWRSTLTGRLPSLHCAPLLFDPVAAQSPLSCWRWNESLDPTRWRRCDVAVLFRGVCPKHAETHR